MEASTITSMLSLDERNKVGLIKNIMTEKVTLSSLKDQDLKKIKVNIKS